jgi:ceramide glucosyltransferase
MTTILVALAGLSIVLTLAVQLCLLTLLRRRHGVAGGERPAVSILKPLKGEDDELYANLVSFARQDYPRYQIVFGAEDPRDPALAVARRVQREFPHVRIDVVAGAAQSGRNPKVGNLAALSRAAVHDLWLVSDSNVRVEPDYLQATVPGLGPGVGIVTNLFAGVGELSTGALLENLQLNTWIASGLAGSQVLTRRACVVGKSMLFHRSLLQRLGGWAAFADILAEDYVMGTRAEELGLRTVLVAHVVRTVNSTWSLPRFLNRHLRWAQIRRRLCMPAYLAEPLLNPLPWLLLAGIAGAPLFATLGTVLKIGADYATACRLRRQSFPLRALLAIPVKDLLLCGVWAVAGFRRRVWWRGHDLWIGEGTVLQERPRQSAAVGHVRQVPTGAS